MGIAHGGAARGVGFSNPTRPGRGLWKAKPGRIVNAALTGSGFNPIHSRRDKGADRGIGLKPDPTDAEKWAERRSNLNRRTALSIPYSAFCFVRY